MLGWNFLKYILSIYLYIFAHFQDADLDSIGLPHITQLAKKAETVDATDVIQMDIEFSSPSEDPMKDFLIQALVTEDERVGVYDKNVSKSIIFG